MPTVLDQDQSPDVLSAPRIPSRYQSEIYSFDAGGEGDGLVDAVAGSGKTTTLVDCANNLPGSERRHAAFVAFNSHIVEELRNRLPGGMTCQTSHSFAFGALKDMIIPFSEDDWVDRYKYNKLARAYWKSQGINTYKNPEFEDCTTEWLRLCMLTRVNPDLTSELLLLRAEYGLSLPKMRGSQQMIPIERMQSALTTLLEWGWEGTPDKSFMGIRQSISFDDMLHYALNLEAPLPGFQRLYVDEAQDFSAAHREMAFRMRAPGGRILFVGDPFQSIYLFAGADSGSFEKIGNMTGARKLPLSICYRCPESHLELAQEIVPHIEPRPNAPQGVIEQIKRDRLFTGSLKDGDLVLCRMTAPLIELAFALIQAGIPAIVRGRDIGKSLWRLVETISRDDRFRFELFLSFAQDYKMRHLYSLTMKEDNQLAIQSFTDRMRTVELLYQGAITQGVRTLDHFKGFIESLFSDERKCITLSTVHKAKGLENDRVFLLEPDPIPHITRPSQAQQEMNLRYVALTRAKQELYFIEK